MRISDWSSDVCSSDLLGAVSGAAADDREQPLLALNTAMMMNGFVLRLAEGTVVHEPIEVVHLGGAGDQPLAYHPRNLIVLAPRSQVTLIEHPTHLGPIGEEEIGRASCRERVCQYV